jgi:hypothetical protein
LCRTLTAGELAGDIKAVLLAEIDVDEGDVRLQLTATAACLGAGRRDTDDADPLALEQVAGSPVGGSRGETSIQSAAGRRMPRGRLAHLWALPRIARRGLRRERRE